MVDNGRKSNAELSDVPQRRLRVPVADGVEVRITPSNAPLLRIHWTLDELFERFCSVVPCCPKRYPSNRRTGW